MTSEAVVIGSVAIGFLLLRFYAYRRIARRDGRFVWVPVAPFLFASVATIWIGIGLLSTSPILGLPMLAIATLILGLLLRALFLAGRGVSATPPDEAFLGPMADFMVTTTMLGLLVAFVGVVALLVWLALR